MDENFLLLLPASDLLSFRGWRFSGAAETLGPALGSTDDGGGGGTRGPKRDKALFLVLEFICFAGGTDAREGGDKALAAAASLPPLAAAAVAAAAETGFNLPLLTTVAFCVEPCDATACFTIAP